MEPFEVRNGKPVVTEENWNRMSEAWKDHVGSIKALRKCSRCAGVFTARTTLGKLVPIFMFEMKKVSPRKWEYAEGTTTYGTYIKQMERHA